MCVCVCVCVCVCSAYTHIYSMCVFGCVYSLCACVSGRGGAGEEETLHRGRGAITAQGLMARCVVAFGVCMFRGRGGSLAPLTCVCECV